MLLYLNTGNRDEMIWSSQDTIHIDMKGANMIIYDQYKTSSNCCKNTIIHYIDILIFIITKDKHTR